MSDTVFRFLALLLLALASACSLIDPHNMIGRQAGEATPVPSEVVPEPGPHPMGAEARKRAFDFVWTTINERYLDPHFRGIDWHAVGERYRPLAMGARNDDEFWDVLDRMAGELKDSHTRVESPKRVQMRERNEGVSLGFSFLPIEGKLAVVRVNGDSDAWWAGVRPGMTIASIDGESADAAYARALARTRGDSTQRTHEIRAAHSLVRGDAGKSVSFTFERADASRLDVTLERRKLAVPEGEIHRVLPSGFGYLRMSDWSVGVIAQAHGALDQLARTPGLVIDLRGNPGGSVHAVNSMLARFFPHRTDIGQATTRTGKSVSLFFGAVDIIKLHRTLPGDPDAYTGPVAILIDGLSASGSELFAGSMQATGRATVLGEPSCGCLLSFLGYARIPGGGALAYSEVGFVLSNGKHVEGEGVVPDVPVPRTLADLRASRDRALERAQDLLRSAPRWNR